MGHVATIGLDIAKSVFQVHGVDAEGGVVIRQKLTRARLLKFFEKLGPCLVGIEACGTAHHWARELIGLGHDVRLMPPSYVKPYVKRQKNDMADAEAICEAVTRPTMRFVPVKSPEQQSVMVLHRTRSILIRQRIQISNAIRSHMAEFGMAAAVGRQGLHSLIEVVHDAADERVPVEARGCLTEAQIIGVLREQEAGGVTAEVCRRHGISEQTFYRWKAKYSGMSVSDAQKLKTLEDENRRLKKLLAESMLDVAALKDLLGKN
jgi:transposase